MSWKHKSLWGHGTSCRAGTSSQISSTLSQCLDGKMPGGAGPGNGWVWTHCQHQRTPCEGHSSCLCPEVVWGWSDPTDPAAPRTKQAEIYSILNPNLSLQPPSGKDSTPGNAAAPPCPALSLQLPAHFSGSLRANFDGFKSKHTAPGRPFLFVSEGFNPDQSSQTQGFPSFSAGISLLCTPWPWDAALASLALAASFSQAGRPGKSRTD